MNREIKFRAKEIGSNKWVYGYYCKDYANVSYITTLDGVSTSTVYEDTLCQFTGLKDKNGVDIYEGDILKRIITFDGESNEFTEKVIFNGASFCTLDIGLDDGRRSSHLANYLGHKIEVIGNIHENPELL